MYIYVYMYICAYMCTWIYAETACVFVSSLESVYTCVYDELTHTQTNTHTHTHSLYMYICIYTNTHTHVVQDVCMNTHIQQQTVWQKEVRASG